MPQWKPTKKDVNTCDPEEIADALRRGAENDRDHENRLNEIENFGTATIWGNLAGDLDNSGTPQSFTALDGEEIEEVYGTGIPDGKKLISTDLVEVGRCRVADGVRWEAVGCNQQCLTNS